VTLLWRPEVRLNLAQVKEAVLRWRGAVRYGGASVAVSGVVEAESEAAPAAPTGPVLQASGTGQRFQLRPKSGGPDPASLHPGEVWRVAGRVIKGGEGKNDEIWLELERAEPVDRPGAPGTK
jgi:hypothetical protein